MKERPVACSACAVVSIESDRIPGFPTGGKACLVSPFDTFQLHRMPNGVVQAVQFAQSSLSVFESGALSFGGLFQFYSMLREVIDLLRYGLVECIAKLEPEPISSTPSLVSLNKSTGFRL